MPRTRGLAHVNLHVSDLDRSTLFYREVFGLEYLAEVTTNVENAGQPVVLRQVMLSTPGREDLLALTYAVSGAYLPFDGGGVDHIGFIFESDDDVRTAVDVIPRFGGRIVKTGEREQGGFHEFFAYVADPDGYKIELCTQLGILGLKKSLEKKRANREAAAAAAPVTATAT